MGERARLGLLAKRRAIQFIRSAYQSEPDQYFSDLEISGPARHTGQIWVAVERPEYRRLCYIYVRICMIEVFRIDMNRNRN